MTVQSDIKKSRKYDMETYLGAMKTLYDNAILQNGEIYDFAFELTNGYCREGVACPLKLPGYARSQSHLWRARGRDNQRR